MIILFSSVHRGKKWRFFKRKKKKKPKEKNKIINQPLPHEPTNSPVPIPFMALRNTSAAVTASKPTAACTLGLPVGPFDAPEEVTGGGEEEENAAAAPASGAALEVRVPLTAGGGGDVIAPAGAVADLGSLSSS